MAAVDGETVARVADGTCRIEWVGGWNECLSKSKHMRIEALQ